MCDMRCNAGVFEQIRRMVWSFFRIEFAHWKRCEETYELKPLLNEFQSLRKKVSHDYDASNNKLNANDNSTANGNDDNNSNSNGNGNGNYHYNSNTAKKG